MGKTIVAGSLITVLILSSFLMAGAVYASGLEVQKKAGDYNIQVKFDKNPPVVGNNNMEINISDTSGKPVTDAKVIVNYSMPAMPGMPAANFKAIALLSGTKYAATMNPTMSGSWNVAVKIMRGGRTSTARFNVDAS